MRPATVSQTGVGASSHVRLDYRQANFQVGVGCVVSGTATYTLQHTFDDPATGINTWFDNSDTALVDATTNQDTNYSAPIQASRVNVTVGTGTVTITYLQGNSQ